MIHASVNAVGGFGVEAGFAEGDVTKQSVVDVVVVGIRDEHVVDSLLAGSRTSQWVDVAGGNFELSRQTGRPVDFYGSQASVV